MALALRRGKQARGDGRARRNHILIRVTPVIVAFCVLGLPESILERSVIVLVGAIALSYLSTRPGPVAMGLIAGFIVMQIVLPVMFRLGVPQPMVRMAVFWKEALVATLVLAALRHRRLHPIKPDVIDGLAVGYVVLVTGYWLFPGALTSYAIPVGASASQVAFRGAALPVIGLLAVRHSGISAEWRRRCLGAAIFVGCVLTVGSILEMSFPRWWDNFLSNTIGLIPYQRAVLGSGRTSVLSYADFNNARSQRSGSFYADPLLVGFTYHLPLAAALAWSLAKPRFRSLAVLGFIGAGLFLVQGRAALLGGVVIFIVALRRRDQKASTVTRTNLVLLIAAGGIIAFPFFASSALGRGHDLSPGSHRRLQRGAETGDRAAARHRPRYIGRQRGPVRRDAGQHQRELFPRYRRRCRRHRDAPLRVDDVRGVSLRHANTN
jgi:hypothetical protein